MKEHGESDDHSRHEAMLESFRRRLIASLVLTVPILVFSREFQAILGFTTPRPPGLDPLLIALSLAVYVYGGKPFLEGMIREVKNRRPAMMTLVGVAITVALAYSIPVTLAGGEGLLWELTTLIDIMLLGHLIEMKATMRGSEAVEKLATLIPAETHLVSDGETVDVHIGSLKPGDVVLVKPGERIPSDGVVVEGEANVDESLLTGESKPVFKTAGNPVIGGALNLDGALKVRVEKVGEGTFLSNVIRLVNEAQMSKSKTQLLADKAASILTSIAIVSGLLAFTYWVIATGDLAFAVERMVSVVVVACPHALGLAIPLVVSVSTSLAALNGMLIRNRVGFEEARKVDAVVFDKTGTLTKGEFTLARIDLFDKGLDERDALGLTAALEALSEHSLGKPMVEEAKARGIELPRVSGFKALPGRGVYGLVDGREVYVGGLMLLRELGLNVDEARKARGANRVFLVVDGEVKASFTLSDVIREESGYAVKTLKSMGVEVFMVTGDDEEVAREVAGKLGIERFFARVTPEGKVDIVKRLQAEGWRVAMVGDGINDAPALAHADVGVAIGAGTDVAVEAGDVVIIRNDPRDVATLLRLSKATYRKMLENILWATWYNALTIPLAGGLLYGWGILLPPALGAVLMTLSDVIVAANALTLRRFKGKI